MKLTAVLGCSTSAIMFFYAHEIMRYWIGPEFARHSLSILMILAIANLLFVFTTAPGLILEAQNRIKISHLSLGSQPRTNVLLLAVLVPTVGLEGAAWAVLANAATLAPLFLYYTHSRVLHVSLRDLVTKSLLRPIASVIILAPAMIWTAARVDNLLELIALCVATFVCYFVVMCSSERTTTGTKWPLERCSEDITHNLTRF